jgi:hypothetical protein
MNQVSIKIAFKGEMHRLSVASEGFTLEQLHSLFQTTYAMPPNYTIQYKDNEGDIITVVNGVEFQEATRVFTKLNGDSKSMSFFAITRNAFSEVVEPMVKAVEDFAEKVASAATELVIKAREQEWAQKAKTKCQEAGEVIKRSAKETGVIIERGAKEAGAVFDRSAKEAGVAFQHGAAVTGEFIQEKSKEVAETEFVQQLVKFAEDVRVSITELVEQQKGVQDMSASTVEAEIVEVPAATEVAVAPVVEEVAATEVVEATAASSEDWDIVAPPSPVEQRKWDNEYNLIRDMFPEASYEQCESLLNRYNGNVQVVINAMMDI